MKPVLRQFAWWGLVVLGLGYVFIALLGLGLAAVLLIYSETLSGHLIALLILVCLLFPLSLVWLYRVRLTSRKRFIPPAAIGGVMLLLFLWLYALTPSGHLPAGAGISSFFLGTHSHSRGSIWSLLPETDQIKLGVVLSPLFDPVIDSQQARRIWSITEPNLQEMEARPEYRELPSVRNYAWAEWTGGAFDVGHVYQYVPPNLRSPRPPVLIFLHGYGGNFKCFLWVWRKFADRHGYVVLCPSFGFGNWYQSGGVDAIEKVRHYSIETLNADPDRIYLAGLSNGGFGVSAAGTAYPDHYAGLIYISPAMSRRVSGKSKGPPVLVIHGRRDDRISIGFIEECVHEWIRQGAAVTFKIYPDEDHFLFFSSLEKVFGDVEAWLKSVRGP